MASSTTTSSSQPDWVILDRYVFSRDAGTFCSDDDPSVVSGTNSRGDKFHVWFQLGAPPRVSRLYLQLGARPTDVDARLQLLFGAAATDANLRVVASHRDALLLQMHYIISGPGGYIYQMIDYFIYRAGGSRPSLALLPPLGGTMEEIEARIEAKNYDHTCQRLRRMEGLDIGVLCCGEEVAVAELQITLSEVGPELHVLYPSRSNNWEVKRAEIIVNKEGFDLEQFLFDWEAQTVVPFGKYMCWIDYTFGVLMCDLFDHGTPNPRVYFLELPDNLPGLGGSWNGRWANVFETVGVTKGENIMKFVMVARDDGKIGEYFRPGSGFTITSWTLRIAENNMMLWEKDAMVKANELWDLDGFAKLPHELLEFPVVSMDDPNVVYFVLRDKQYAHVMDHDETWLVAVDLRNVAVKSTFRYINPKELTQEEADFAKRKHQDFQTFLPAEFSKHLNLHGTRACNQGEDNCDLSMVYHRRAPKRKFGSS